MNASITWRTLVELLVVIAVALPLAGTGGIAHAQAYPSRPITLVVP